MCGVGQLGVVFQIGGGGDDGGGQVGFRSGEEGGTFHFGSVWRDTNLGRDMGWVWSGVAEGGSDLWFIVVGVWLGPSVGIEEGVWEGIVVVVIQSKYGGTDGDEDL